MTTASPRVRLVASGFLSHLVAGVLPFLSAAAIAALGLFRGTAMLYAAGSVLLAIGCLSGRLRRTMARETIALISPPYRRLFVVGLAAFLGAGLAYYVGLTASARVAEYIFLTRLDWLAQALVAVVWLGEVWTARGLTGAMLALVGGLLLAWTGAFGVSGVMAALIYIAASLIGYSSFKPLSVARGIPGAVALSTWRHVVNTCGFAALALLQPTSTGGFSSGGVMVAAAAGVLIVVLFVLRFVALTGIPLWVLSAQAPTQALVAVAITIAGGGTLPVTSLLAISLIVAGELLVTWPAARADIGPGERARSAC